MSAKCPTSVFNIAALNMLAGCLGLLYAAGSAFLLLPEGSAWFHRNLGDSSTRAQTTFLERLDDEVEKKVPLYQEMLVADVALTGILSLLMICSAFGLLAVQPWGRNLALGYAGLSILVKVVSVCHYIVVIMPTKNALVAQLFQQNENLGLAQMGAVQTSHLLTLGIPLVLLPYPLIVLFVLTRSSVVKAFQRSTTKDASGPSSPVSSLSSGTGSPAVPYQGAESPRAPAGWESRWGASPGGQPQGLDEDEAPSPFRPWWVPVLGVLHLLFGIFGLLATLWVVGNVVVGNRTVIMQPIPGLGLPGAARNARGANGGRRGEGQSKSRADARKKTGSSHPDTTTVPPVRTAQGASRSPEKLDAFLQSRVPYWKTIGMVEPVIGLLLAVVLLLAGILLFRLHPWARLLSIGYAAVSLLWKVFTLSYYLSFLAPALREYFGLHSEQELAARYWTVTFIVLSGIYPLLVLMVMFSRSAIRTFRAP